MRRTLPTLLLCLAGAAPALAAPEVTALSALKILPHAAPELFALIEGYDGQPTPERWNVVVYDAREPAGLHEYVVAGGEVVASRAVSQFASKLRSQDVIGIAAVKVDSDRVVRLAQDYVRTNSLPVSTYNYELKKDGEAAVPLWRVSCLGKGGEPLAYLVVTATRGNVVSHDGFAVEPGALLRPAPAPTPEVKKTAETRKPPEPRKTAEAKKSTPPPRLREPEAVPVATPIPMAPAPEEEERRPGLIRRAGGSLQRIFTGR